MIIGEHHPDHPGAPAPTGMAALAPIAHPSPSAPPPTHHPAPRRARASPACRLRATTATPTNRCPIRRAPTARPSAPGQAPTSPSSAGRRWSAPRWRSGRRRPRRPPAAAGRSAGRSGRTDSGEPSSRRLSRSTLLGAGRRSGRARRAAAGRRSSTSRRTSDGGLAGLVAACCDRQHLAAASRIRAERGSRPRAAAATRSRSAPGRARRAGRGGADVARPPWLPRDVPGQTAARPPDPWRGRQPRSDRRERRGLRLSAARSRRSPRRRPMTKLADGQSGVNQRPSLGRTVECPGGDRGAVGGRDGDVRQPERLSDRLRPQPSSPAPGRLSRSPSWEATWPGLSRPPYTRRVVSRVRPR